MWLEKQHLLTTVVNSNILWPKCWRQSRLKSRISTGTMESFWPFLTLLKPLIFWPFWLTQGQTLEDQLFQTNPDNTVHAHQMPYIHSIPWSSLGHKVRVICVWTGLTCSPMSSTSKYWSHVWKTSDNAEPSPQMWFSHCWGQEESWWWKVAKKNATGNKSNGQTPATDLPNGPPGPAALPLNSATSEQQPIKHCKIDSMQQNLSVVATKHWTPGCQHEFSCNLCDLFVSCRIVWNFASNPQLVLLCKKWIPGAEITNRWALGGHILKEQVADVEAQNPR